MLSLIYSDGLGIEKDMRQARLLSEAAVKNGLKGGIAEKAGLSGNVHKLTWLFYGKDGSPRAAKDFANVSKDFHALGVGKRGARRDKSNLCDSIFSRRMKS